MRLALIADEYVPARTSVAVQMRDLANEFLRQGHEPTVIVPSANIKERWVREKAGDIDVLRVRAPRTKDISLLRRALAEFLLPHSMRRGISRSPLAATHWDGVIWYSPTIFFGPLVQWLKQKSGCRSYLILRDIFPDWAVDTGVMKKGLAYSLLKQVEQSQYNAADIIGVQTPGNLPLLNTAARKSGAGLEVLHNWLTRPAARATDSPADIRNLEGKTVFVYAGNMGVAQGVDCLIDLAAAFKDDNDVAFLFVGRGTETSRLKARIAAESLANVTFLDEVEPSELPSLLDLCDIGVFTLDPRHTTHNIPGKFLTYLQAGLPVLARVNLGNDLVEVIESNRVGRVSVGDAFDELLQNAAALVSSAEQRQEMGRRAENLANTQYSTSVAAQRILDSLIKSAAADNESERQGK